MLKTLTQHMKNTSSGAFLCMQMYFDSFLNVNVHSLNSTVSNINVMHNYK